MINGTDILFLNKCQNIHTLDLSQAEIVSGGMPYYEKDNERFITENNILGPMWCYNLSDLTWLKLPETLAEFGQSSMSGKTNVLEINIPNSVTSIGLSAFSGCSGLTSVTIGNSVTSIGSEAFSGCSGLTSVTIDNSVTYIGSEAFYGCSGLTSVTIGNSVTKIGSEAFRYCRGLTSVTIPNSVTEISSKTFYGCSGLTSVTIGNSVTYIGQSAFEGCSKLVSINIPDPVKEIGSFAFSGCTALESVVLPSSLSEIKDYAFYKCPSIKFITVINPNPPVIGSNTFSSYEATLRVPDGSRNAYWLHPYWSKFGSIVTWGGSGFDFVVDNITYHVTSEIDRTVEVSAATLVEGESGIQIPAEVTHENIDYYVIGIANNGLENCNAATISLPCSIEYVGLEAFKGCGNLQTLECWALTPPSADSNSFDQAAYSTVELLVPKEAVDAYNQHAVWSLFMRKGTDAPSIGIDADAPVSVYTLSGVCVMTDAPVDALDTLAPGIYIVRQGPSVKKIAIK